MDELHFELHVLYTSSAYFFMLHIYFDCTIHSVMWIHYTMILVASYLPRRRRPHSPLVPACPGTPCNPYGTDCSASCSRQCPGPQVQPSCCSPVALHMVCTWCKSPSPSGRRWTHAECLAGWHSCEKTALPYFHPAHLSWTGRRHSLASSSGWSLSALSDLPPTWTEKER